MAMQRLNNRNVEGDDIQVKLEKKGEALEGYYAGTSEFQSKTGDDLTKHLVSVEGKIHSILGNTVLNQELEAMEAGTKVRITFDGERVSKKGRNYKAYVVEFDPEDRITA